MAESTTARLGINRWTDDGDTWSRAELDASFAALETLVAIYGQGTLAARPASGTAGRLYFVTGDATAANNNRTWYDTGAAWVEMGSKSTDLQTVSSSVGAYPLLVSGVAAQTAALTEWRSSAAAALAQVTSDGALRASITGAGQSSFGGAPQGTARLSVAAGAATVTPLSVYGAASQSAALTQWRGVVGGGVLASVSATGLGTFAGLDTTTLAASGNAAIGGTLGVTGATTLAALSVTTLATSGNATIGGTLGLTGALTLAAQTASGLATLNAGAAVKSANASSVALAVSATSGQTANLAEFRSSAAAVLASIGATGQVRGSFFEDIGWTDNGATKQFASLGNTNGTGKQFAAVGAAQIGSDSLGAFLHAVRGSARLSAGNQALRISPGGLVAALSLTGSESHFGLPAIKLEKSGTQTIPDQLSVTTLWYSGTPAHRRHMGFRPGDGRIVVPVRGIYRVTLNVRWDGRSGGQRACWISLPSPGGDAFGSAVAGHVDTVSHTSEHYDTVTWEGEVNPGTQEIASGVRQNAGSGGLQILEASLAATWVGVADNVATYSE